MKFPIENIKTLPSLLSGAETELKSRGEVPEVSISTLPKLNFLTWGLPRGTTIIGGRTSNAKSSFAIQLASDFSKQDIDTVFMSLEDTENQIIERMFSNEKEINNFDLKRGWFKREPIISKWEEFKSEIEKRPLLITCGIGKTLQEVNEFISILDPKPKVMILDYIQMTKIMNKEREEMSEYLRRFRELMLLNGMRGIIVSQINRMIEKDNDYRPRLENLKGTGSLEENADMVLLLHWGYFYNKKQLEKNDFDLLVAKNKTGSTGAHKLHYSPEYYKFSEVPEENKGE